MFLYEDIWGKDIIKRLEDLKSKIEKKHMSISMWGVAPIAPIHLGYDSLILLQRELTNMGFKHTILIADLHAIMSHNLTFDDVRIRSIYYSYYLTCICGLKANIVYGSDFQTRPSYIEDLYGALRKITISQIKDTIPSTRKNEPFFSYKVIYPIMQCIDVFYVNADVIIAEEGQRKIYRLLANIKKADPLRQRPKDIVRKIDFIYIPTSHDIMGRPLKHSNSSTRISIHENEKSLKKKIIKMYAPPSNQRVEEGKANALLEFFRYSVFPWINEPIKVHTKNGVIKYERYSDFEKDYTSGLIRPEDAKDVLYSQLLKRISAIKNELKKGISFWINEKKVVGGD